ncbi:hypothetical protein BpHYR1_004134 [Brachionus plicatilis]|uniref:Uncharacterized protein n=1 Tax=Brachionus plicatilis TaxID=10195 RepID=A0A3M7QHK4_BRAPC|nr:hypothetical protein BpHYR1_004134 [Brachionus plicatilis]
MKRFKKALKSDRDFDEYCNLLRDYFSNKSMILNEDSNNKFLTCNFFLRIIAIRHLYFFLRQNSLQKLILSFMSTGVQLNSNGIKVKPKIKAKNQISMKL